MIYNSSGAPINLADTLRLMSGASQPALVNFLQILQKFNKSHKVRSYNFLFPFLTLPDAVNQIITFMGMQPCERSDKVDPDKSSHSLMLAGVYRGGHDVLVKARLARSASQGVNMKITVRSPDVNACEIIAGAVG